VDEWSNNLTGIYNIITGEPLWISPIVPLEATGALSKLDINDKLTIKNINVFGDKADLRVRRITQGATQFIEFYSVNSLGSGLRISTCLPS
jgi:hypothetical protein